MQIVSKWHVLYECGFKRVFTARCHVFQQHNTEILFRY